MTGKSAATLAAEDEDLTAEEKAIMAEMQAANLSENGAEAIPERDIHEDDPHEEDDLTAEDARVNGPEEGKLMNLPTQLAFDGLPVPGTRFKVSASRKFVTMQKPDWKEEVTVLCRGPVKAVTYDEDSGENVRIHVVAVEEATLNPHCPNCNEVL